MKVDVELEMENKKIIDDGLCTCLAILNILIKLVTRVMKHAKLGRDHVTIADTVTRVANES